jgi:hypothetical protein
MLHHTEGLDLPDRCKVTHSKTLQQFQLQSPKVETELRISIKYEMQ